MTDDRPSNPTTTPRAAAGPPGKLFGFVTRRERWGLSRRGWLASVALVVLAGGFWLLNVQPFLAPTRRLDTRILVVEGWVPSYVIKTAVAEFQAGHYEKIYTTGGPVVGDGGYSAHA